MGRHPQQQFRGLLDVCCALQPTRTLTPKLEPFLGVLQLIRHLLRRSECLPVERQFAGRDLTRWDDVPWQGTLNSICERYLGSVRRECLDHVIILGRRHLKQVLEEFSLHYFNTSRPHQGIGQRVPVPSLRQIYRKGAKINSVPVLRGLHHDYQVAA